MCWSFIISNYWSDNVKWFEIVSIIFTLSISTETGTMTQAQAVLRESSWLNWIFQQWQFALSMPQTNLQPDQFTICKKLLYHHIELHVLFISNSQPKITHSIIFYLSVCHKQNIWPKLAPCSILQFHRTYYMHCILI